MVAGAEPGRWQVVQSALRGHFTMVFAVDLQGVLDLLSRERPAVLVLCSRLIDVATEQCLAAVADRVDEARRIVVIDDDGAAGDPIGADDYLLADPAADRSWAVPRIAHLAASQIPARLVALAEAPVLGQRASCRRAARRPSAPEAAVAASSAYREMVVGSSPAMQRAVDIIARVAPVDVTVLLAGETGTGKELFARRLHGASRRARGPFRAVSLPAIPCELFESLLFGHERGAFTGAVQPATGAFEQASGGTLFLDEVSSLALDAQPKLLRAIQEKEIERVGGRAPARCDVRVVAATNADLLELVAGQRFRDDLYHRLSVITVDIPPLRDRRDDIPALAAFFVDRYAAQFACPARPIGEAAMRELVAHSWPGNVRELENRVQKALLLAGGGSLGVEDFFPETAQRAAVSPVVVRGDRFHSLEQVEHAYIQQVIDHTGGNQSRAAEILGIDRKTLRGKLQRRGAAATRALRSVPA